MNFIESNIAIGAQLYPQELQVIAAQGIKSIICHRPDHETLNQPTFAELAEQAEILGIKMSYLPVKRDIFSDEVITGTANILKHREKTLMFCRSGARSCIVWAILAIQAGKRTEEVLGQAKAIGYDLFSVIGYFNHVVKFGA